MVSFKTLAIATAALAGNAMAYVDYISAPSTPVVAGENVTVSVTTSIYIENWSDMGIMWGLTPHYIGDGCVGLQIFYTDLLGGCKAGVEPVGTFTIEVPIPEDQAAGSYTLNAAVPYLVGASGETGINVFNTTINVSAA